MAVPTMTADSPAQGSISWVGFTIQYMGVAYAIAAGNTAERFVWWRYRGGGSNSIIEAGPNVPADLTDDDVVLFGNRNGVPLRIQATSIIDGDLLIDGSVVTKSLASDAVTAEVVKAGSLTGDLFSSNLVLGSTISTGVLDDEGKIVGARVELGPTGLVNYDAAGQPVVYFPLSGKGEAFIRANVQLLSAEILNNLTIRGKNNAIAKDAAVFMAAGVEAPSVPLSPTYRYDSVQFDTNTAVGPTYPLVNNNLGTFAFNPGNVTSMHYDPELVCWVVAEQRSTGVRIWRFTRAGALYQHPSAANPWVDDYNGRTMAKVADGWSTRGTAMLYRQGTDWFVSGYQTSTVMSTNRIPASWIVDAKEGASLSLDPALNQYVITQNNGTTTGAVHTRHFTLNTYSGSGTVPYATSRSAVQGPAYSASGPAVGDSHYGALINGQPRLVKTVVGYVTVEVWDNAMNRKNLDGAYEEWTMPSPQVGLDHDGNNYYSLDTTGLLIKYENWNWASADDTAWVGTSAFDSDVNGIKLSPHVGQTAGQHETPVGGLVSFKQRRRAKMALVVPQTPDAGLPDDIDKWRVYTARQIAEPTAAQLKLAGTLGSPTVREELIMVADATGAAPPGGIYGQPGAVNNFPPSNPGRFASSASDNMGAIVDIKGDGSWRLGSLSGGPDGRSNMDFCRAYLTANQVVPGSTWTNQGSSTAVEDTNTMFSNVANVARITIKRKGLYRVSAKSRWNTTTTGWRGLAIKRTNAANVVQPDIEVLYAPGIAGQDVTLSGWQELELNVGDYITIQHHNTVSPSLTLLGVSPSYTTFAVRAIEHYV